MSESSSLKPSEKRYKSGDASLPTIVKKFFDAQVKRPANKQAPQKVVEFVVRPEGSQWEATAVLEDGGENEYLSNKSEGDALKHLNTLANQNK